MEQFTRLVRKGLAFCTAPQRSAPEPVNAKPRPMTGLISQLTPEQLDAALSYKGPTNHGAPEFLVKNKGKGGA